MTNLPQPSMSHRFRLSNSDGPDIISLHVALCELDLVKKQLRIEIRQPLDSGSLMRSVQSICESYQDLQFDILDGNCNPTSSTIYRAKAIKHNIKYDYATPGPATHELILKYKTTN